MVTNGKSDESTLLSDLKPRVEKLLGVKDLITSQRIQEYYATLVAENFLRSVIIEAESGIQWDDEEEFEAWFAKEFGVYKIIVAAGKSQRISPTGLIHKQILRADDYNTNVKLSRAAGAFGKNPDVVVIDSLVAYHILSERTIAFPTKERICLKLEREFDEIISRCQLNPSDFHALHVEIVKRVKDNLLWAHKKTQKNDVASTMRFIQELLLEAISDIVRAEHLGDEIGCLIFKELIYEADYYVDIPKRNDLLGGNCLLTVAKPYGPGEAFMAGLSLLEDLKLIDSARYSMPIYSDYAPALLLEYPNIYFHCYLKALSRFHFNGVETLVFDRLPVVTVGGKSPLDRVEGRGNIILTDSKFGPIPQAIKEWREMSEQEQQEAKKRLEESRRTGEPRHALNAGVFVIDTKWAMKNFDTLRKYFDHPFPERGRLHEYWYTDLVEIAAKEYDEERKKNPDIPPRTKIVFLGQDAPSGNKDVSGTLAFQSKLRKMIREQLIQIGVFVDENARVTIGSKSADFDIERDINRIFGSGADGQKTIDQIYLFGRVHLETDVKVENGAVLDGRGKNGVVLKGKTIVGKGVRLKDVIAVDTTFEGDERLDGFSYYPPCFDQPARIEECRFLKTYVESKAEVRRTQAKNCHIAGKVIDSELEDEMVVADEVRSGWTEQSRIERLSVFINKPESYVKGAFRVGERDEANQKGLISFVKGEILSLYQDTITDPLKLKSAEKNTEILFSNLPLIRTLTAEQLYRYGFGQIRFFQDGDAFKTEKENGMQVVREFARKQIDKVMALDVTDEKAARALFFQLAILATQANFFDWQSESARKFLKRPGFFDDFETHKELVIAKDFSIDCRKEYAELVFSGPWEFLYLTDGATEAFLDATIWLFLCRLGHRVTVVGKAKPARGDATVEDIQQIVSSFPALKTFQRQGKLKVISNGCDTYGILLDKAPREFEASFLSSKAIIAKGQANLYMLSARNDVKAVIVFKLLSKGMTAELVTGVPKQEIDGVTVFSPIIAVLPYGEHAISFTGQGETGFEGNLRKLMVTVWGNKEKTVLS
jgi:uncharacterized protein with ATP-grasp and redox domains